MRALGFLLILLGLAAILPAPAGAQAPSYLLQWGSYGSGNGQFSMPVSVVTDVAGDVYVVDRGSRIQKFTGAGVYLTQWGSLVGGDEQFSGVATDPAGNVYAANGGSHRIEKFTGVGMHLTQWGSFGTGDGQFIFPHRVATDAAGDVYAADSSSHRIQKFTRGSGGR